MQSFLLNRKPHMTLNDIPFLQKAEIKLIEDFKKYLPERSGSRRKDGEPIGWALLKVHQCLHGPMERILYGYSENTSASGGEFAHKVINYFFHDLSIPTVTFYFNVLSMACRTF